jgi:hypothetical protein
MSTTVTIAAVNTDTLNVMPSADTIREHAAAIAAARRARMTAYLEDFDTAVKSLFGENAKLTKLPGGSPVFAQGISLAPGFWSGFINVCGNFTKGCFNSCVLQFAGRTTGATVRAAARARTGLFKYRPDRFYARARHELRAIVRKADKLGARAHIRLNTASDIEHGTELPTLFPTAVFYHYTKFEERCIQYARGMRPANEHYSFSVSEKSTFDQVKRLNALRVNLIVVFDSWYHPQYRCRKTGAKGRFGVLPERIVFRSKSTGEEFSVDVRDGDAHDLRTPEYDGRGVAVGLRLKGSKAAKKNARDTGFAKFIPGGPRGTMFVGELVQQGTTVVELA